MRLFLLIGLVLVVAGCSGAKDKERNKDYDRPKATPAK